MFSDSIKFVAVVCILSLVTCFARASINADTLDTAIEDISLAVTEDGDDAVIVRPTRNSSLCAAAIKVAVSRCRQKEIDTLIFESGEYDILPPSKVSDESKLDSEVSDEEPDVWEDIADFFDIDSDDISDFRKSRANAPTVSNAAVKIDGLNDMTIDASKARFICPPDSSAFAFLNCKTLRVNMGEFVARGQKAKSPAVVFAGCRGVSATVKADSSSPTLFFSNCSNALVKDSLFRPDVNVRSSEKLWNSTRGLLGENSAEKKRSGRLLAIVEFESCRVSSSVKNCVFEGAEISPVLIDNQCARAYGTVSDSRAIFEFIDSRKATVPFAAKGDEVMLFDSDGAFLTRAKIVSAKPVAGFREELEFDVPIFADSKKASSGYVTASNASSKLFFSHNELVGCFAPISISADADIVSNAFKDMGGIAGVEILNRPDWGACAKISSVKLVRNTFATKGAAAAVSECLDSGESAARHVAFSRNEFSLSETCAAYLSRIDGVSFSENKFVGCGVNSIVLSFSKCKNISVTGNDFSGGVNLRIADKDCSGNMNISENTGAKIIVKKIFK